MSSNFPATARCPDCGVEWYWHDNGVARRWFCWRCWQCGTVWVEFGGRLERAIDVDVARMAGHVIAEWQRETAEDLVRKPLPEDSEDYSGPTSARKDAQNLA